MFKENRQRRNTEPNGKAKKRVTVRWKRKGDTSEATSVVVGDVGGARTERLWCGIRRGFRFLFLVFLLLLILIFQILLILMLGVGVSIWVVSFNGDVCACFRVFSIKLEGGEWMEALLKVLKMMLCNLNEWVLRGSCELAAAEYGFMLCWRCKVWCIGGVSASKVCVLEVMKVNVMVVWLEFKWPEVW